MFLLLPFLANAEYFELREVVDPAKAVKTVTMPRSGEELGLSKEMIVSQVHIETAKIVEEDPDHPGIEITLNEEGAKRLAGATKNLVPDHSRIVILIDGKPLTAPILRSVPLGKRFRISCKDREETEQIARELLKKK